MVVSFQPVNYPKQRGDFKTAGFEISSADVFNNPNWLSAKLRLACKSCKKPCGSNAPHFTVFERLLFIN
jgi:hypothetical protein